MLRGILNPGGAGTPPKKPEDEGERPWDVPKADKEKGYFFDPSGLERAADAVKLLDSSPNVLKAYELTKMGEQTKQLEIQERTKAWQAEAERVGIQRLDKENELHRQKLAREMEEKKRAIEYEDKLKRQQQQDMIASQRMLRDEELKKREEAAAREEALKRKTLEYEALMRKETEIAKIKAETEGKIKYERANHALHLEEARVKAREYRETVLESIKVASTAVGAGVWSFLNDKDRLISTAGVLSLVALGVYSAKTGTGVAGRFIESRLGKPSLVRETSRKTLRQLITHPLALAKEALFKKPSKDVLHGIVFHPEMETKMRRLAFTAANTKSNSAPFRHLLLHGHPGTGKTMYAKALAKHSGMDYAILTGGDVAPLGSDAVTEIHKLFDWAEKSRKGLLLFVDEADAFLQKRSEKNLTPEVRNALNAFLYRTGEASSKFMLVFSSNQPEQFDWAINDRIDEVVEFTLPGFAERSRMIKHYFSHYIVSPPEKQGLISKAPNKIEVAESVTDDVLEMSALQTDGFSGREISKLVIAWQAAAYGTPV